MSITWDPTSDLIGRALDLRLRNQNVIASNVANADTPDFKALKMDFEKILQDVSKGEMSPESIEISGAAEVQEDPEAIAKANGNTVNRDQELVKLGQEQLMYNSAVTAVNKKLALLKYAITEGGGGR